MHNNSTTPEPSSFIPAPMSDSNQLETITVTVNDGIDSHDDVNEDEDNITDDDDPSDREQRKINMEQNHNAESKSGQKVEEAAKPSSATSESNRLKCTRCSSTFATKSSLERHLKTSHGYERYM